MRRLRSGLGVVLLALGTLLAVLPFVSVWRVGGEMLGELPDIDGADVSDAPVGPAALFDDDFVLARRTYTGTDDSAVTAALAADGFAPMGVARYSKTCCGDYDAVWANVRSGDGNTVLVELTAADSDWRVAWPLFGGLGTLLALAGLGLLVAGSTTTPDRPSEVAASAPPSGPR